MRLDLYLTERKRFRSRHRAQHAIKKGVVTVNGETVTKPGAKVRESDDVKVVKEANPYVSFGGIKLKEALDVFSVSLEEEVVLDVGSSTGGFTDCALKKGAAKVYALDVGTDQLLPLLAADPRVERHEQTHFLKTELDRFSDATTVFIDVSFTSSIPFVQRALALEASIIVLIKPQFETRSVPENGVIRNQEVLKRTLGDYLETLHPHAALTDIVEAARKEKRSNREFFLYIGRERHAEQPETLLRRALSKKREA